MSWKSKGLSVESIIPPSAHNNFVNPPSLNYLGTKIRVRFTGSCLKQPEISYTHGKIVNICIVYEINKKNDTIISDSTLENCLFDVVTLTKNVDIGKYGYSSYEIRFDRRSNYSFLGGGFGQNVLILGVDMSFSTHIDNKKKDILVLGKGPTQELENTLTAEKMHSINLTEKNKKFCLKLHYNGTNSYLFVNGTEIYTFKAKDSEIVATPLCLGNISKNWLIDNMKKLDLMTMFMILVQIIMLLMLMILKTFKNI